MVSLCNLHPNTILHISIFIHFYEAYLGILPYFNLFRHLFWLKKRGGSGSKVVGGVPSAARWNGGGVPYYAAEHVTEELERQVVLHEAEPPGRPLRHRAHLEEPEELVKDAKQR